MFDVYLNNAGKRLIVPKGANLPAAAKSGNWEKKKTVTRVSADMATAIEKDGFYQYRMTLRFEESANSPKKR
jgi:hypothetical protein